MLIKLLNKKILIRLIKWTMFLISLTMISQGWYKAYLYSSFYNEEATVIIEKNNTNQFSWNSSVKENDNYIKSKFTLLSGNDTIGNLSVENEAKLTIETNTKRGKAKILIINEKNEIILFKEFNDNKEIVNLESGEYKIIFVGKWFTGNVVLSSKNGSLSN